MNPLDTVGEMGRFFDDIGVDWVLGGSMASSVTGQPRATMDIDMAVRMGLDDVRNLVNAVTPGYYASETMFAMQ
jgi:hypothetical protein